MRFRAKAILPAWDAEVLSDAILRVEGGLVAGIDRHRAGEGGGGDPGARDGVEDLGDVLMLPGFANAHAHLELTAFAGRLPRAPLWDWIAAFVGLAREPQDGEIAHGVRRGIHLLLEGGCTAVADVCSLGIAPEHLLRSPLRALVLEEGRDFHDPAMARPFHALEGFFARFEGGAELSEAWSSGRLRFGFCPHAPYTASLRVYEAAAAAARLMEELGASDGGVPAGAPEALATHLLETREERDFWAHGTGPFRDLLAQTGRLPKGFRPPGGSIVESLDKVGFLGRSTLLAHGNHLTPDEIALLARRGAAVAFCPGTHAFFGRTEDPITESRAAGLAFCLGTDSLASNDGLSMLAEIRRLSARGVPAREALRAGTEAGARALGFGSGRLEPGANADWIAVEIPPGPGDPVSRLLDPDARIVRVEIAGRTAWTAEAGEAAGPEAPPKRP